MRGDRVFLMRLGREPRGVFGSGTVVVEPYEDIHWDPEKADLGKIALFIQFQIDGLLDPEHEPILWRERLKSEAPFSRMHWDTQMSGIRIPDEVANELEKVWHELVGLVYYSFPEEVVISQSLVEGVTKRISVFFSIASSSAWIDFFLPTTKGATICGKITISRSGIKG